MWAKCSALRSACHCTCRWAFEDRRLSVHILRRIITLSSCRERPCLPCWKNGMASHPNTAFFPPHTISNRCLSPKKLKPLICPHAASDEKPRRSRVFPQRITHIGSTQFCAGHCFPDSAFFEWPGTTGFEHTLLKERVPPGMSVFQSHT